MKDKILGLIKENKANFVLFVSVLLASTVLFKLSFVYKDETEKFKSQKEKLSKDAKQINQTNWLLAQKNALVADKNTAAYKETFNEYYQNLIDTYNHDRSDVATMRPEDVQDKFIESLDLLEKICQNSKLR